jgi:hypothetical protein
VNEQKQTVTLKLEIAQLNTVLAGIAKLPIEVGIETFTEVQRQAQAQLGDPNTGAMPASALGQKLN